MKRASFFLTMLVLASLLLAACGAETNPTSVPNTTAPMETSTSAMPATEASTSTTVATTSTSEASLPTPGIPVTGGNSPSQRITNMIGSSVCGMNGDQLGTVQDMVLDFNQAVVTYMIVDANGRSVAVPYSFLIKPRGNGTGTGTGNGAGSGSSGTGTQSTSTPSSGGTGVQSTDTPAAGGTGTLATGTPSAGVAVSTATSTTGNGTGTTGTGNLGTGTAARQNCLTLSLANEIFTNAPAFDSSVMPGTGQSAQDWDTDIMDYWVTGGAPPATSTPAPSSGSTDTTATATPAPGLQQMQGLILASDLLGANIVVGSQGAGTGTGSGTGTGTGSSLSTSTPSAGGTSSTAVPDTTATASSGGTGTGTGAGTGTGSTLTGNSQGTVQDVIIDPRIGKLQFLVVSLGGADTWIPVPISLLGWDAVNNQVGLMIDAGTLQNAPSFSSSQFPDLSAAGWGQQFSTYWSGGGSNGAGSGTGTGSGGTTSATATATP